MSIEKTQKALDAFLSTDAPEVLAIKGEWGVGKTFYWKAEVEPCIDEKVHDSFKKYSYVSLFGLDSLEDLKFAVFQNAVNKKEANISGKSPSLDMFSDKTHWKSFWIYWRRLSKIFDVWRPNISVDVRSVSYAFVRDTVVCLDDMERASDSLDFRDILGLVSSLKEQKNCKVILIFNDEKLSGGCHAEHYKELREKVIDVEISFSPTAEELARLIFGDADTAFNRFYAHANGCAMKLDIRNIRILKKVKRVVDMVLPMLSEFEEDVSLCAIHTLTLLTWSYYSDSHDENVPSYAYIKSYNTFNELKEHLGVAKHSQTSHQKEWNRELREYGYGSTGEFELVLADIVEKGYVDRDILVSKARNTHEQVLKNKADRSFRAAWDLYRTFDDNEEQLVCALREVLVKFARRLLSSKMDQIFTFLVEMGYEDEARCALSEYVELNKDKEDFFDIESNVVGYQYHPEVLDRFRKMNKSFKKEKSLEDAVGSMARAGSWGSEEQQIVAQATQDDFYKMFKKLAGNDLYDYIGVCLKFGESSSINAARSAWVKIGRESKLNAHRVRGFFNIDIDKEPTD